MGYMFSISMQLYSLKETTSMAVDSLYINILLQLQNVLCIMWNLLLQWICNNCLC